MADIAARKQALRDEDERALASGQKSREDIRRANSLFAPLVGVRVRVRDAKPLR